MHQLADFRCDHLVRRPDPTASGLRSVIITRPKYHLAMIVAGQSVTCGRTLAALYRKREGSHRDGVVAQVQSPEVDQRSDVRANLREGPGTQNYRDADTALLYSRPLSSRPLVRLHIQDCSMEWALTCSSLFLAK
jgi:hypothetical protein